MPQSLWTHFQSSEMDMVSPAQQGCLKRLHELMLVTAFTIQTWHILGMLQKFTKAVKYIFGKQVLTLSDIFEILQFICAVTIQWTGRQPSCPQSAHSLMRKAKNKWTDKWKTNIYIKTFQRRGPWVARVLRKTKQRLWWEVRRREVRRQFPLPGLVRAVTRGHINDDKKPSMWSSGGEKASRERYQQEQRAWGRKKLI